MTLFLMIFAAGCLWFWFSSARARESVIFFCHRYCRQRNLQLLDQTVTLRGIEITRSERGQRLLKRKYSFDFSSDGNQRLSGYIWICDEKIVLIDVPESEKSTLYESNPQ